MKTARKTIRQTIRQKIASMTTSEAAEFLIARYNGCTVIEFDGAQASSPVIVDGSSTQYQVADFSHRSLECIRVIGNAYEFGNPNVIYVVGSYWSQSHGWETSVSRYIRS